ncbi:uncharacterized protein JCM10292_000617 [Rhodotorula paludigena]|uniref:uncharacterized protein n=1 Tax=Rhodotorula paludigena TaxID=86838 RepID=UPI00317FD091
MLARRRREVEREKLEKEARAVVEKAVEEAKASPEPAQDREMWTDVYYAGTNPMFLPGRKREEVHHSRPLRMQE